MEKFHSDRTKKFLLNFITSYSILLILILVMGLFLYSIGIKDAQKNIYIQNHSLLKGAVSDLDSSFILMSTLSTQLASNSELHTLADMTENSPEFYITAGGCMDVLSQNIPLISTLPVNEYYIYLKNTRHILYTSHLSDSKYGFSSNRLADSSSYVHWLETINSESNNKLLLRMNEITAETEPSYLYKIPLSDYSLYQNYNAFVCFEIDEKKFSNYFANVNLYNTGFICICDASGNIQYNIYDSTAVSQDEIEKYRQLVLNDASMINRAVTIDDMIVTTVVSNYNNWTYILVQPSDLTFNNLLTYQQTYSFIILTTCFCCCILIYFLSKKNVKPILQISSQLETSLGRENELKETLERQRPIIDSTLVSRLMKGLVYTKEDVNEIAALLSLTEPDSKYAVLFIKLYGNSSAVFSEDIHHPENDVIELSRSKYSIKDMLFEYFGKDIHVFEPDITSFAVLITSDADITLDDFCSDIADVFTEFHISIMDSFSVWSIAGLGNRNSDLSYAWKSYQQAVDAISYIKEKAIFECYSNIRRDTTFYYYPFEMAQQLSNFINGGNSKQVTEIFRLIKKENFENRSLPLSVVKWLVSDVRNTLLKTRYSINTAAGTSDVLETVDSLFSEECTLELLEDISLRLCSLYIDKTDGSGNKLISSIQTYLDANFNNPALSLKVISDEFSISESYFSYLFKAETGQNFSEYIEQLRMEHAMQLLKESDIVISELYLEVGYNNANSFRRAFKKVHGVSPKTIRDSINNNQK